MVKQPKLGVTTRRVMQRILSALFATVLAGSAFAQGGGTVGHRVTNEATAAQIEAYWTPDRMRVAIPVPALSVGIGRAVKSPTAGLPPMGEPGYMRGWDPSSGLPQPTPSSFRVLKRGTSEYERTMATRPTTFGSPPANPLDFANYGPYQRWTWQGAYLTYPTSTIGKIFFTQNGTNFECSGTVWNRNSVLTAGHCVSTGTGTFSSNILFCPSYNASGVNPNRGCWAATQIWVTTAWHTGSIFDRDYGCFVTPASGTVVNNRLGNVTGWAGFAWNFPATQMVFATGYPAESPFTGSQIVFTAGAEWYVSDRGGGAGDVSKYIGSDQNGGTSGGGWWLNLAHPSAERADVDGSGVTDPFPGGASPMLNGLNSHKRCLSNCTTFPPTATQGPFWSEQGSPQFFNSASDNADIADIYNLCANSGGN